MGHISVIHKKFTYASNVFRLQFLLILYFRDATKLKFLEIQKVGWPTLVIRGSIYQSVLFNQILQVQNSHHLL